MLPATLGAATPPTYVGMASCAKCHAAIHAEWTHSRHSKMVQPATKESVQGDFKLARMKLRGANFGLRERDGVFYISESYLTGKSQEHKVDYTLGNRRIQHYLTTLADGKSSSCRRAGMCCEKAGSTISISPIRMKSKACRCRSGTSSATPATSASRRKISTSRRTCIKPRGSISAPTANAATGRGASTWPIPGKDHMVVQTKLDATRNTMVCAQCHSFRDTFAKGFAAGDDYYNYFLPILEYNQPRDKDPAYWADGRTRRFSNDAYGLWQSECFLKGGVTCVACHTAVHQVEIEKNPQLRPTANALCTRCHIKIGEAIAAHTHHASGSAGSSCVECHMPRTVYSIKAEIRDHSMSIPVPENTIRHGIPNACNLCHKDRDANWSIKQMDAWYGDRSRQKLIRRADAFALAGKGDPRAITNLLAILAEPSEGPLVRANAVGHLSRFSIDPTVFPAIEKAKFNRNYFRIAVLL